MATSSRFRFSIGRFMVELALLTIPLGLVANSMRDLPVSVIEVAIFLGISVVFAFEMEILYWFFLRTKVVEPLASWYARSRKPRRIEEDGS